MKTLFRSLRFYVSHSLFLFAGTPALLAQSPFNTTLVAAKGDLLHGEAALLVAGPAAIDAAGDVAFHAIVRRQDKTNDSGILLYSGSTPTLVAKVSGTDPVTGGTFSKISDPVLSSDGSLAFIGTLKTGNGVTGANNSGIYVLKSGTLNLVARTSGSANTGGNFSVPVSYSSFSQIVVENNGGYAFLAGLKGHGVSTTGIFATDQSGNLNMLIAKGHGGTNTAPGFTGFVPLPLIAGQSRTFDTITGNGTLSGPLDPPFAGAIGLALSDSNGFQTSNVVHTTGSTPKGGTFKSFSEPTVNANGTVAFLSFDVGTTNGNVSEIWLVTGGTNVNHVVRTGAAAPDTTGSNTAGVFSSFSSPVLNNHDQVAFVGTLKTGGTSGFVGSDNSGIWSNAPDGVGRRIVLEGDDAPDAGGGKFSAFKQLVLPDIGGPVFVATLRGVPATQNTGVWASAPDGTLAKIVRTGDMLDVHGVPKKVKSIGIFQLAPKVFGQSRSFDAPTGNLVYQATFTDGSWAIYKVTPAP